MDGDSSPRPFAGGLQAADLFRTGNRRRQAVAHGDGFVARLQRRENEDLPRFPRKAQFPPLFGKRDGETVREPVQRARRTDGAVPVTVRLDDGAELYPFGQFFPDRGGVAADGFQIDISAGSQTVII